MADGELRAGPHHSDVLEAKIVNDFLKPDDTPFEGLDEGEFKIRTRDGQAKPGQAGTASNIGNMAAMRDFAFDDGAVQDVPAPEPGNFPRTNEAPFRSRSGKMLNVTLSQIEAVSENLFGGQEFGWSDINHCQRTSDP
ncbi:hypothetical protein ARTHROSP310_14470 [Arthrobacter sp. AD-310]